MSVRTVGKEDIGKLALATMYTPQWLRVKLRLVGKPVSQGIPARLVNKIASRSERGVDLGEYEYVEIDSTPLTSEHDEEYCKTILENVIERPVMASSLVAADDAIYVRYGGSAVWWTNLEEGPVRVCTLADLAHGFVLGDQFELAGISHESLRNMPGLRREFPIGKRLYLLSLEQWENQEWPPEKDGGPPQTKHCSLDELRPHPYR